MEKCPSSSRTDRKTIEKNRRNQMKALFSKLNSLVPHQRSRVSLSLSESSLWEASLPDQLDDAVNYIKKLQTNLEKLREKKDRLMGIEKSSHCNAGFGRSGGAITEGLNSSPLVEIHEMGSALGVLMITGLDYQFMFNESIRVIQEEGADIVNASFSVVKDTIFHTIHSKVRESAAAGSVAARISERLKKFVNDQDGAF
ncbi:hypothetical protein ACFX13_005053 [Malus domestica]